MRLFRSVSQRSAESHCDSTLAHLILMDARMPLPQKDRRKLDSPHMCAIRIARSPARVHRHRHENEILSRRSVALFLSVCVTHADKTELLRVENASGTVLVAHDAKALADLLAEDWRVVSVDATLLKRAELFKMLVEGTLKFQSYK